MSLKSYIERLHLEDKEKKLVEVFEKLYPNVKIFYTYKNSAIAELRFRKEFCNGIAWRIFKLTDFNCVLTQDFANFDYRSDSICLEEMVKDTYIKFMSQNFSDYKYRLHILDKEAIK